MRKAYSNVFFITEGEKKFIGVSLGYDYCAEHEWGIKGIRNGLCMPSESSELTHLQKKAD